MRRPGTKICDLSEEIVDLNLVLPRHDSTIKCISWSHRHTLVWTILQKYRVGRHLVCNFWCPWNGQCRKSKINTKFRTMPNIETAYIEGSPLSIELVPFKSRSTPSFNWQPLKSCSYYVALSLWTTSIFHYSLGLCLDVKRVDYDCNSLMCYCRSVKALSYVFIKMW